MHPIMSFTAVVPQHQQKTQEGGTNHFTLTPTPMGLSASLGGGIPTPPSLALAGGSGGTPKSMAGQYPKTAAAVLHPVTSVLPFSLISSPQSHMMTMNTQFSNSTSSQLTFSQPTPPSFCLASPALENQSFGDSLTFAAKSVDTTPTNATITTPTAASTTGSYDKKNLYVSGLPTTMREADLKILFQQFGTVESLKVMLNLNTGESRGAGFILFSKDEEAAAAFAGLDKKQLDADHQLCVRFAYKKARAFDGTPTKKIFIRNIPADITELQLRALLSKWSLEELCVREDSYVPPSDRHGSRVTSRPTKVAHLVFSTFNEATEAAEAVHQTKPWPSCEAPLLSKIVDTGLEAKKGAKRNAEARKGGISEGGTDRISVAMCASNQRKQGAPTHLQGNPSTNFPQQEVLYTPSADTMAVPALQHFTPPTATGFPADPVMNLVQQQHRTGFQLRSIPIMPTQPHQHLQSQQPQMVVFQQHQGSVYQHQTAVGMMPMLTQQQPGWVHQPVQIVPGSSQQQPH